jgi:hypothetical protein
VEEPEVVHLRVWLLVATPQSSLVVPEVTEVTLLVVEEEVPHFLFLLVELELMVQVVHLELEVMVRVMVVMEVQIHNLVKPGLHLVAVQEEEVRMVELQVRGLQDKLLSHGKFPAKSPTSPHFWHPI